MSAPLVERLRVWECPDTMGAPAHLVCEARTQIECDRRTIEAQAVEIERLKLENSTLAADQCHEGYGDEYGNHQCRTIDRLRSELAAKDAAVQILLDIPLVCVTDAEIAHAKERRAAAIRASGKEG